MFKLSNLKKIYKLSNQSSRKNPSVAYTKKSIVLSECNQTPSNIQKILDITKMYKEQGLLDKAEEIILKELGQNFQHTILCQELCEIISAKKEKEIIQRLVHDQDNKNKPNRQERIIAYIKAQLAKQSLHSGQMLEIGGRRNPINKFFPTFQYNALDLTDKIKSDVKVIVGDITNCPKIPDNSFDLVMSIDVFEHIDKPWLAAKEISRILKPGGITVHSTLFSWRYHPCPIDYWRFSAEGLKSLFTDLECLDASFDFTERRRNIIGRDKNRLKPDKLGGWRENVRVNYAGIKR